MQFYGEVEKRFGENLICRNKTNIPDHEIDSKHKTSNKN